MQFTSYRHKQLKSKISVWCFTRLHCHLTDHLYAVVKLLSKRWWIPIGATLEGPKLESEGQRAEVGFPTADQGFSSIQGTLFGFYDI